LLATKRLGYNFAVRLQASTKQCDEIRHRIGTRLKDDKMVVQSSQSHEWVEGGDAPTHKSAAEAHLAADNAGKEDLIKAQKLADQQRRAGKAPSIITKEFGPLLITGLESIGLDAAAQAMRAKWLDSGAKKTDQGQDSAT